jgi:hypothetical protein
LASGALNRPNAAEQLLRLASGVAAVHAARVAAQHFELGSFALPPEMDVEFVFADAKITNCQIGQPLRERRIHIELVGRGVELCRRVGDDDVRKAA